MILTLLANKYVQMAIIILAALAALWGYGARQHSLGYSQAQNERHTADLEAFQAESKKLQGLSVVIETHLEELRAVGPKFIEDYENVIAKNALPGTCVIDTERLRSINSAIEAATARKPVEPLPSRRANPVK